MNKPKANDPAQLPARLWVPGLVFTSLLILFLMVAFFFAPQMSEDQRGLVRFLSALCGGFAGAFLGGTATLQLDIPKGKGVKIALSATGGIAIFLFLYFQAPYWYTR